MCWEMEIVCNLETSVSVHPVKLNRVVEVRRVFVISCLFLLLKVEMVEIRKGKVESKEEGWYGVKG